MTYCPDHNKMVEAINRLTILHVLCIGVEVLILLVVI